MINKSFVHLVCICFAFALFLSGCESQESVELIDEISNSISPDINGTKLENPYSTNNMQAAYDQLVKEGGVAKNDSQILETTHLYVVFEPISEAELSTLKSLGFELYSYPLDYEFEEGVDPFGNTDRTNLQLLQKYAAVPIDKLESINCSYSVLEELYIPEESDLNKDSRYSEFNSKLTDLSLLLTGNISEKEYQSSVSLTAKSRWRPAGRVMVFDDNFGTNMPVIGLKIRARRWFTTRTGITGADGFYSCDGFFSRPANYSLNWERAQYSIRAGDTGQAYMLGPKTEGDWNITSPDNSLHQFYMFVHLGAHLYYYEDIGGMRRPPNNSLLNPQMKIAAYGSEGRGNHNKDRRYFGVGDWIKVYQYESSAPVSSVRAFSTILHELGHASHWETRSGQWTNTDKIIKESWAFAIQLHFTRFRYPAYNPGIMTASYASLIDWGESVYTPLFADLIDTQNQGFGNTIRPIDRVSGYTMNQVEDIMFRISDLDDLDRVLSEVYSNPTENFLFELTDQYVDFER